MNSEARRPSSSSSSEDVGNISADSAEKSSTKSSRRSEERINSSQESGSESSSSKSSISGSEASDIVQETKYTPPESDENKQEKESYSKSSGSSSSEHSVEEETHQPVQEFVNGNVGHSDSGSSAKEKPDYSSSSIVSESDKGLLRSILSDSSSEKIVTDIDVGSPKEGKFSSSTDEELLRKFREQQANRRFRPRSAKFRRDAEPEPETVQRVHSRASDKGSSGSYSSGSTDSEDNSSGKRKRHTRKPRKASSSTASKSSVSKKEDESSRSPSPSSSTHSSDQEKPEKVVQAQPPHQEKTLAKVPTSVTKTTTTGSETSDSLTTSATSPSENTQTEERPPSRQGKRPKSSRPERTQTKSKPGERDLQRNIEHHRRRLHNLLAQEYLQRHLEIELRKAGAQFKQYERGPRPISPKQIRKFRERNVTWVFVDGKLYNVNKDMGSWNTTQRGRQRNKVIPKKGAHASKSRSRERSSGERSKRSVSFEKGSGRRRSSARSADGNPLTNFIKGLSPRRKKKRNRRGSSSGSRKSSLSSKGSARSSSRTSQGGHAGRKSKVRSRSSSRTSRSRSRSSSKEPKSSSRGIKARLSPRKDKSPRDKQSERPKTAKPSRVRSRSSSKSSKERASSKDSGKKKKKKSGSTTSSDKKSKKSKDSSKHKDRHYHVDEDAKMDRVLFTEDYERKLRKKKKERETVKLTVPPGIYDTKHHTTESTPALGRRGDRPHTAHPPDRRPNDDYNFYRDPNIPGHAFPYYYLSYLLSMESKNRRRSQENGGIARIVLKPAPVNKPPAWRTRSARPRRPPPKPRRSERSPSSSPKSRRKKKTKSVINEKHEEKPSRSSSRESRSSSLNRTSSTTSHPRIRPGSGPIRCSWKSQTEPERPKFPGSDHQLKDTDNPAVLAWLRRKDAQLRVRRQNEIRKHRKKTEKLIDEQNDLEDKHERALRQYEVWKKEKDREILLRRRKEAKEANSAVFAKREKELQTMKRKERPRTATTVSQKAVGGSTFSELRSSSASPNTEDKTKPRKQRPKSANTIGVTFSEQMETSNQRPRSATPPRKTPTENHPKQQSVFQKTENFLKSFLGVSGSQKKEETPHHNPPTRPTGQVAAEERDEYDKWVRFSTPSGGVSSKVNGKKRSKGSSAGRARNKGNGLKLPPHNHVDNELISKLAKRRIETILASRKRVDTGLKKRPKSAGVNGLRNPTPPRTDPTHRKWKLREDIITANVKSDSQNSLGNQGSSSSSSSSGEERPKFSFAKKSPSTNAKHHRNPVVRQALSGK